MKCYGLFHYGSSYAAPYVENDTEEFDSIKEALDSFAHRIDYDPYYPCAGGEEASAWIFFYDPRQEADPYPDRVYEVGPRGGVRRTS